MAHPNPYPPSTAGAPPMPGGDGRDPQGAASSGGAQELPAGLVPAPLGPRVLAALVDALVWAGLSLPLLGAIALIAIQGGLTILGLLLTVFSLLLLLAYLLLVSWLEGTRGITPGKPVLSLRTVRARDGQPLGFGRALARTVLLGIPVVGLVCAISVLLPSRPAHRGLHDQATDALVIDRRRSSGAPGRRDQQDRRPGAALPQHSGPGAAPGASWAAPHQQEAPAQPVPPPPAWGAPAAPAAPSAAPASSASGSAVPADSSAAAPVPPGMPAGHSAPPVPSWSAPAGPPAAPAPSWAPPDQHPADAGSSDRSSAVDSSAASEQRDGSELAEAPEFVGDPEQSVQTPSSGEPEQPEAPDLDIPDLDVPDLEHSDREEADLGGPGRDGAGSPQPGSAPSDAAPLAPVAVPEPEHQTEPELESEPEPELASEPQPEPALEPTSDPEPAFEPTSGPEVEPEPEVESDPVGAVAVPQETGPGSVAARRVEPLEPVAAPAAEGDEPAGDSLPAVAPEVVDDDLTRTIQPVLPPAARLRVRPSDGPVLEGEAPLILGRNPDHQAGAHRLLLADETRSVSKTHLRLDLEDGQIRVTDLGSTNGTTIVGPGTEHQRLAPHHPATLVPGARLMLGDRTVDVEVVR